MKTLSKRSFVAVLILTVCATALPSFAGGKTEDQLIAELSSPSADKVASAMQALEKEYPGSAKAATEIKKYLTDKRDKVRRKAARVIGVMHADVTDAELNAICELLKGTTPEEIIDGLKSLRGLKSASKIPQITPLLSNANTHPNVLRDACRTLAVIGGKDLIPQIEPLTKHANKAVAKDAEDAIYALKAKP